MKNTLDFIISSGKEKNNYLFLNGTLGKSADLMGDLKKIHSACRPESRLIIYQYNYLWQWFFARQGRQNWLSVGDLKTYLEAAGFQVTRIFRQTLCPVDFFGLGRLINFIGVILPFFDVFKLDQFIIARMAPALKKLPESLTICITVRNEQGNIEPLVKSIPPLCNQQEILFVEGHSTDGTRQEIRRVIKKYPAKNIRVIGQPGTGQGDATKVGFKAAKGEIIIIYEGDNTSDPGDIDYFYQAMKRGRFEFIEGTRFVYPKDNRAMPLINQLGNIFFAKWFSFFLGQRTTDVLSGIKAILKRDYEVLYKRWGFLGLTDPFGDFELLYGASRMGLKIGEIPIRYYPRTYGETKTKPWRHGLYLLKMALKGYFIFRN